MAIRGRDRNGFGRLHVLTDPDGPHPVLDVVDGALDAGAPTIQVRTKQGHDRIRLAEIEEIVARCNAAGATCIVNDRVDLALAGGAHGVHLGSDDLPVDAVRALTASLLVGATVRSVDAAGDATAAGASYLGIGPVFETNTKRVGATPLGVERAGAVARAAPIPSVAIAGVTAEAVAELVANGFSGVAVVGAVSRADDPAAACSALLDLLDGAE